MKKSSLIVVVSLLFMSFKLLEQEPWKAPESAKALKNPVTEKKLKASAKNGEATFNKFCVVCHGPKGMGDGPGGKALTPTPANLTSARVQAQQDGELFWKMTNGRGPMIKWGPIIKESDRWDLVNYIRTLKK